MDTDSPLQSLADDRFNRGAFASRIAETLRLRKDPSSLIVGLHGIWGEGKTTVLNFIEESLGDGENVICLRFNPWRFPSEDRLLESFFHDLAQAIDVDLLKSFEKRAKKLSASFWSPLLSSRFKGADAAVGLLAAVPVEELRGRLEAGLETAQKRVVILIDDIDRLERAEIQAVFRLVKLTADLRFTAYVLAFDRSVVADALQESFGDGTEGAGQLFLEKIIQVPLNLPPASSGALRKYCFERVDEAIALAELALTEDQVNGFVHRFQTGLEPGLRTPRAAVRYGNILSFSLPMLRGEVNAVDHLLIEGIHALYPKLHETIRDHPDAFLGSEFSRELRDEGEKERRKVIITSPMQGLSAHERESLVNVIKELFPRTREVFGGGSFSVGHDEVWQKEQRICSRAYFDRYFTYTVGIDDVADADLVTFKAAAERCDAAAVAKWLDERLTSRNSDTIIQKIRSIEDEVTPKAGLLVAEAVAACADRLPVSSGLWSTAGAFTQASYLVTRLIRRIPKGEIGEAAKKVIGLTPSLPFAIEFARSLGLKDRADVVEDPHLVKERGQIKEQAEGIVAERVMLQISSPSSLFDIDHKSVSRALACVRRHMGVGPVREVLKREFQASTGRAVQLVTSMCGARTELISGKISRGDFERENYNLLEWLGVVDVVVEALTQVSDGGSNIEEPYPDRFDDVDGDERTIRQVLWMHRHVIREKADAGSDDGSQAVASEYSSDTSDE